MEVCTRIGLGDLVRNGMGSVKLPEEATLYCPQCGVRAEDKGDCKVSFQVVFKNNPELPNAKTKVELVVDCRGCGCNGEPPTTEFEG